MQWYGDTAGQHQRTRHAVPILALKSRFKYHELGNPIPPHETVVPTGISDDWLGRPNVIWK